MVGKSRQKWCDCFPTMEANGPWAGDEHLLTLFHGVWNPFTCLVLSAYLSDVRVSKHNGWGVIILQMGFLHSIVFLVVFTPFLAFQRKFFFLLPVVGLHFLFYDLERLRCMLSTHVFNQLDDLYCIGRIQGEGVGCSGPLTFFKTMKAGAWLLHFCINCRVANPKM